MRQNLATENRKDYDSYDEELAAHVESAVRSEMGALLVQSKSEFATRI
jgi:hypothetical protein